VVLSDEALEDNGMIRLKAFAAVLILAVLASACQTVGGDKAVPPTPPEQGDKAETQDNMPGYETCTVRPAGEYFLYPGPDAVFLALPEEVVQGGSTVEVLETGGDWVHLRSGESDGWLPKWYLQGADEEPVRENVMDYLILKENMQGLLYPNGPGIVDLEKGKLLKPMKEWKDWYFTGIIVYDIPSVQYAWVPKDALLPIGEMEPSEGFLHEGTEIYETNIFEASNPPEPIILDYTMSVFVNDEKDGYIAVGGAGGWTAWTKKENLKMSRENGE
jgi:hypothetical protein